jgi:hypothetical protein
MKFRFGILIGLCAGYYFGAKAGRMRYEQINRAITKMMGNDTVQEVVETAKDAVDLTVDKAHDKIEGAYSSSR